MNESPNEISFAADEMSDFLRAVVACVDDLGARNLIEFGHLSESKHPAIVARRELAEASLEKLIPLLTGIIDRADEQGLELF